MALCQLKLTQQGNNMNYSTTYAASLAIIVGFIIKSLNLHLSVSVEEIVNAIGAVMILGGALVTMFERYKKGGITPLGFRKM